MKRIGNRCFTFKWNTLANVFRINKNKMTSGRKNFKN